MFHFQEEHLKVSPQMTSETSRDETLRVSALLIARNNPRMVSDLNPDF